MKKTTLLRSIAGVACAATAISIAAVIFNQSNIEDIPDTATAVPLATMEVISEAPEEVEMLVHEEPEIEEDLSLDLIEDEMITQALLDQGYLSDAIPLSYEYQDCLRTWCEIYGVPYSLALGVIETESSFVADAKNGRSQGYMQISSVNLTTLAKEIGVNDLGDSLQNLHSGVYMLSVLYGKYGDWSKALIAYNYGEAGAYTHCFQKGITSTTYSRLVLERAEKWADVVG